MHPGGGIGGGGEGGGGYSALGCGAGTDSGVSNTIWCNSGNFGVFKRAYQGAEQDCSRYYQRTGTYFQKKQISR